MYKSEVFGEAGIVARVVAKSKSSVSGKEIVTFELEYPRIIHSELMTHKMLSKNAASSRAIPISKTIDQVLNNPARPVQFGKNQPGMQAKEILEGDYLDDAICEWNYAAMLAADQAKVLNSQGLHKQIVNRILEPFVFMKTVMTGTEWNNWYHLRNHEDADPTIHELARVMLEATNKVEAEVLQPGEWHVPYVSIIRNGHGRLYVVESGEADFEEITHEEALQISSSCCAQVSFRSLDPSPEKAERVYKRLVESKPVHASPFEHQGTPMQCFDPEWEINTQNPNTWEIGVTHSDRKEQLWSANFCEWIQHRQLISDHVVEG